MNGFATDAPKPPLSVLRALNALDPGLFLAFARYRLDYRTFQPLVSLKTGLPILWPRWHVLLERQGRMHHLFAWEDPITRDFAAPDMRIVEKIRADVGRHLTPAQINALVDQKLAGIQEYRERRVQELRVDILNANRAKIGNVFEADHLERGDVSKRLPATFSYPGQEQHRETTQESVPVTGKEAGWELPDWSKELA